MSEINIAGSIKEINIFDDPELCNKDSKGECRSLDLVDEECMLFNSIRLTFNKNYEYIKSPECKAAWRKEKDKSINTKYTYAFANIKEIEQMIKLAEKVCDFAGTLSLKSIKAEFERNESERKIREG